MPGELEALARADRVGPASRIQSRSERQKVFRKVDQEGPRPNSLFEHSAQQEVAARSLASQHGEVVCRETKPVFQDARQDSQLDQAVSEAKNLGTAFGAFGCRADAFHDISTRPTGSIVRARGARKRSDSHDQGDHAAQAKRKDTAANPAGRPGK